MKRRLHILILAAVTAMAAMTSCITDEAFPGPGGGNSSADESLVKLTISTPDPESDGVTRAAVFGSDRSNEVNDLLILVLEKSGSDYLYSYAAQGQRTAVDAVGGSASFEATLRATENPVKVVVLANHAIEVMGFDVMTAL
ncbi:MAG: hypothetical protein LBU97_02270, partial [Alistipes sp.]|nr:hypothetical protein [Alistipes sp.]